MATVTDALISLGIKEWTLQGDPQNENEFNASFTKVTGEDKDGNQTESNDPKSFGVTWKELSDEMKKIEDEAPMVELRKQRNAKLAETDFHALSDITMSDDMKTYRQALRDITKDYKSLDDVKWPEKP
tara:strand:- start:2401 stop:2784 length:384 start_codon:yes stop_codon:yes gene_type:complete